MLCCALPNGSFRGCDLDFELHNVDDFLLYQQRAPAATREDYRFNISTRAHQDCDGQCSLAYLGGCPAWSDVHASWMSRGSSRDEPCNPVRGECPLRVMDPQQALVTTAKTSDNKWSSHGPNVARAKGELQLNAFVIQYAFQVLTDKMGVAEDEVMQFLQHAFAEGEPVNSVSGICLREIEADEPEEVMLMQRKRPRSPSPRRRRRGRAQRMQDRSRQENRRQWTRGHARGTPVTSTSSAARVPWRRGPASRVPTTSRPSSAPGACAAASSSDTPIPRLTGEGSGNILWWREIVGLQDPMEEQDTILPPEVAENIANNLKGMSEAKRTQMIAQIVPFLAAFLAELLRAVNMGCPVNVDEIEEEEGDECGMLQLDIRAEEMQGTDVTVLMQGATTMGRFGGLLQQLQSLLPGLHSTTTGDFAHGQASSSPSAASRRSVAANGGQVCETGCPHRLLPRR